jgi:hypothetical protein
MSNDSKLQQEYSRRRMLLLAQSALAAAAPMSLPGYISPASAQTGDQADWRFCNKCNGMFWNGTADKGRCPAGEGHIPQGVLFSVHFDAGKAGNTIQYDWRLCSKCYSLFFEGDPNKSVCATGGGHVAQGFVFGLSHETPPGKNQKDWRFCHKCHVLFWDGSPGKGRCPAGGGHAALGFNFYIAFRDPAEDPGKAIADALDGAMELARVPLENHLKQFLGTGDLLGKGYSLYDINFHLGRHHVTFNRPNFEIKLDDNYLYTRMTQPTIFGSSFDPAFEVHFDGELTGTFIQQGAAKPRVQSTVARLTSITVKPRNITGGALTTAVHFFQMTEQGGRLIQRFMDEKLKIDLTRRINDYLAKF